VVNRSERLLRKLDAEISEAFTKQAREQWDTHLGVEPRSARETDNGQVELTLDDGTVLLADEVLAAQGRISNADTLALEAAGVEKKENGKVKVDEFGRTTAEGVWALGDASNDFDLKHVANQEAKIVQHNLAHPENLRANDYHAVPSGVFTHPQIAVVGMTEADAQATGRELTVKVQRYADVAYGWAMEDTTGFCKVIADRKTGEILGAHIMGPEASTLIQSVVTAMAFGIDARRFATEQYWPHPALTELVENALLGLDFDQSPRPSPPLALPARRALLSRRDCPSPRGLVCELLLARQGEDLVALLGDDEGVLELGGPLPVAGLDGPVVIPDLVVQPTQVDHRLDGQGHARLQQRLVARVVVVQDDQAVVEGEAHSVAGEIADHVVAEALRVGFVHAANVVDFTTGLDGLDAAPHSGLGALDEEAVLFADVPGEEGGVRVPVHAVLVGGDVDVD